MARTRARPAGGLINHYYARGPTGSPYNLQTRMVSNPAFRLVLSGVVSLAILVPLIAIFWDKLLETFGIAMGPVGAIILITLPVAYKHSRSLIFRANRWLSLIAFGTLLFGTLAFFRTGDGVLADVSLGGDVGMAIIGNQDALGILRLVGIGLATIALFAPAFSWRVTRIVTTLLAIGIVNSSGVLIAGCIKLRQFYARRQIKGWIHKLGTADLRQNRGVSNVFQGELRRSLDDVGVLGNIGTVEAPSPVTTEGAEASSLRVEAPEVEEERQQTVSKRPWNMLASSRKEEKSSGWELPPIDLLDFTGEFKVTPADNQRRAALIEEALASHGIEAKIVQINPGPTVTQFGVEPGWFRKYKEVRERDKDGKAKMDKDGNPVVRIEEVSRKRVKVDQITALDKDLSLALAAPSIRMEAPVPGKSLVGIEVPNISMGLVGLRDAIESPEFQRLQVRTKLALALGKGSAGQVIVGSLGSMPHLLIAGATGSGKSVCITSLICGLLMQNTPDDLRLVLIDPKRVELVGFGTLPHLLTPVIVEVEKVVGTLKRLAQEMDRRYKVMASVAARNLEGYNNKAEPQDMMPYLVVVIDELADLMSTAPYDVEQAMTRLAQMGRATGIHLIVATQRPSVDVITGLIKANFPTRMSFAVTSMMDSRVILDTGGAEKLLGRGDMLYLPSDASKPRRLQGVFVSEKEVERIVYFWSDQNGTTASSFSSGDSSQLLTSLESMSGPSISVETERDEDPMLTKARDLAMQHNSISTSLLQRRLGIGYPRAARLVDQLEEEGLVGPGEPGKSRKVLKRWPSQGEEDHG